MTPPAIDFAWWITAVDLPILAGLFWLIWTGQRDGEASVAEARRAAEAVTAQLRENLAGFKLEVARSYASIAYINEVERRLSAHLLRIEAKLDRRSARGEETVR